ncbi:hypothetical protein CISIN_1g040727mg [Citrus sinensis]|uniref:Methyltransferase n=1 Tax=Citrus sinensis TaxID=2711 RepID=A0A067DGB7_CITSI|nr:hypothetical protein CISIN_1g040727mg [Citrus sinensis]
MVTVVVFVGLFLVGVWMLMSSSVVLDSTNGDGDDVTVEKLENGVEDNHKEMNMYQGDENLVKESFDENTESEEESKAVSKNDDVRKREDEESKIEGGDSNLEAGETEGSESNKIEQIESEKSLDENKWMRLHYEHRERYCPEEACTCIAPLPEGYKRLIKWPKAGIGFVLMLCGIDLRNGVKVTGEYLIFPGGRTQFENGALHYIDFILKLQLICGILFSLYELWAVHFIL